MGSRRLTPALTIAIVLAALTAFAQRGFGRFVPYQIPPNSRTTAALRSFASNTRPPLAATGGGDSHRGRTAIRRRKQNLMKIMNEVSVPRRRTRTSTRVALDDPELFKYPIAYIIEVSWWTLTDREAAGLRSFMQKGGFVIVDDFKCAATSAARAGTSSKRT